LKIKYSLSLSLSLSFFLVQQLPNHWNFKYFLWLSVSTTSAYRHIETVILNITGY
jgi:hypothetical protein